MPILSVSPVLYLLPCVSPVLYLLPCVQVRNTESTPHHVNIDVPTLVFDRVLIYLEALALGTQPPSYAAHLLQDLLTAAHTLGIRSLQAQCREKLGNQEKRVRVWTAGQVRHANAHGQCLLTMDGMVLDVTSWLPEHPGGSSIIPAQALDVDSCRFFEVSAWGGDAGVDVDSCRFFEVGWEYAGVDVMVQGCMRMMCF